MFKSKCQKGKASQESCEKQVGKVEQVLTIIIFSFFASKWNYVVQLGEGKGGEYSVLKCISFFWRFQVTFNPGFLVLSKNGCPLPLFLGDLSSSLKISQVGHSCTRVKS